ncbi:hypothetical protein ATI61_102587 [Archangium gephyra]|uniref:Uncharacterized protein n=1 Tax=Archangium gephyra TaxID=48 RepID=A0ABX9K9T5_9BACT|nr:hypothetical protein [Archangium gephyra]REG36210.1 hypothetical protein ATI61_102587 [Archangium gephyra]
MNPELTADALVQLVHRYHPAGLLNGDPRYDESEEGQRLTALVHAHVAPSPEWKGFIQQLHEQFPNCHLWDTTVPWHDPCYSIRVSLPGFVSGGPRDDCIVALLSQLAPVYAIYASHTDKSLPGADYWLRFPPFPPEFQAHEAKLAGLIESTFGFTRLTNDILLTPVPDLVPRTANHELGRAQLIDCLFTWNRW